MNIFPNKIKDLGKKKYVAFLALIIFAIGIGIVSLYFAAANYKLPMLQSYFNIPIIAFFNILPVILLILILFFMTSQVWLSFMLTSIVVLVPTLVNYFKILIRNDPLFMKDLTLISESLNMVGEFSINLNYKIYITVFTVIIITFLTKKFFTIKLNNKIRVLSVLILVIISWVSFSNIYTNKSIYQNIENFNLINRWSQTQRYISNGFVYPFLHSSIYLLDREPHGYSDSEAKKILSEYADDDIPNDEKVDIIIVLLEAYNDFSKFEEIDFLFDVYEDWHSLEEESYHGELVTNIFAGETVNTEWGILTGYAHYHEFRSKTNSYVHYLANQGYLVEGSHPGYKWFYNRENVNKHLGFDNYYFLENHYSDLAGGTIARDRILFPEIVSLHEKAKEDNIPYFSFNVTYQNHGPYPDNRTVDTQYINGDGISEKSYNILNNYLNGIYDTNKELTKFVNSYKEKDATLIILYGDHNPWLGDDNKVYHELGINISLDTDEGFFNYYNTPYLIWANDEAKKILDNEFIGKGESIGPCFLMNKVFELAGYQGNSFMKLSNEVKHHTSIVHRDEYYLIDEHLTRTLDQDGQKALERFLIGQYYYRNNFLN